MMTKLQKRWKRFLRGGRDVRPGVPGRDGFSLVEILMVLLVLTVGILPIAIIQHRSRREVNESDRYTQAVPIAQAQMERIKGLGFGVAAADSGSEGQIEWVCQVTNVGVGLDRIEITASWNSEQGQETLTVADLVSMR